MKLILDTIEGTLELEGEFEKLPYLTICIEKDNKVLTTKLYLTRETVELLKAFLDYVSRELEVACSFLGAEEED